MKRRDLIAAAPLVLIAPALAIGSAPLAKSLDDRVAALSPDGRLEFYAALEQAERAEMTPVQRKYHEWKRTKEAREADMERDDSDGNGSRWCEITYRLADDVVNTPSEGPMDLIYKLMAFTFHGQHELDQTEGAERIWAEARALVGVEA